MAHPVEFYQRCIKKLLCEYIEMGVPAEKIELGFIPAKAWTFAQPIDKTLVLEPA